MKLNLSINDKEEIERFLLIANIGLMLAIKEGVVSIEEAENYLYSPYSVKKIRDLGIGEEVIELVELGCELEDVESLIPDRLNNSIDVISTKSIQLLHSLSKTDQQIKKWID